VLHLARRARAGAFACLICLSSPASGQPSTAVDRSDPSATAAAVLRAYGTRDLDALKQLSGPHNQKILEEIAAQGESHPRYRSIFLGWRMEAVLKWDGKLGEPRDSGKRVQVPFAEAGPEFNYVVTLERESSIWAFEDINRARKIAPTSAQ
jgi:hypothetical protein